MDYMKPPTDNLYKFIALAGLVGWIAAEYFDEWQEETTQKRSYEYETEAHKLVFAFHDFLPFDERIGEEWEPPDKLPYVMAFNAGDREKWMAHLSMHEHILHSLGMVPEASDPDARRRWKAYLHLSDEQYDEMLKERDSKRFIAINRRARAARSQNDQLRNMVELLWAELDKTDRYSRWVDRIVTISQVYFVVGFALWYWKLQRYQDATAKAEGMKAFAEIAKIRSTVGAEPENEFSSILKWGRRLFARKTKP